jgi:hypothetical protein
MIGVERWRRRRNRGALRGATRGGSGGMGHGAGEIRIEGSRSNSGGMARAASADTTTRHCTSTRKQR